MNNLTPQKIKKESAFTFIEVLITLSVIAICFLPLMNMYSVLLDQSHFSSELITARYLAQEGIEKIKNFNYTVTQLKELGDAWDPALDKKPFLINGITWRVLRKVDQKSDPLELYVQVFKDEELKEKGQRAKPVVELATLFEDFEWTLVQ